jgi:carbon-monoxide dehydrogenase large subunit
MGVRYFGAEVRRVEDRRLLTGNGRYVDDIRLPGMLEAAFVRSTEAHARIRGIDTAAARALPGVHGVFTLADFPAEFHDKTMVQPYPAPILTQSITQHPLAKDEVCFVGQTVALVVADSRQIAEDAASLVAIDYEPLPAVIDCREAARPGAPLVHSAAPDNIVARVNANFGDIDAAFAAAAHVFEERFLQHRGGCHAMECRGVIAEDRPHQDGLTIYSATQCPYLVRRNVAAYLGRDEGRVRVIAPDVGGGFGPKAGVYAEEIVIPLAASMLGRPVKWTEDRREHFVATNTQRDQEWALEAAVSAEGVLLGLRGRVTHDNGAFVPYGLLLPMSSLTPLPGPYAVKALDVALEAVFTNTTPNSPIRGAGRPYAAYAMERMITRIARELGLDQAEVRRRNYVPADGFPYPTGQISRSGTPIRYDSGDFEGCLDKALELSDYESFRERQQAARAEGRYLGIGVSSCIEDTGLGPYEGATVRVQPDGKVLIQTGAASQGQGHETMLAQVCADRLDVAIEDVYVRSADTGAFPQGVGTIGSRIAVNASTAVYDAAETVRDTALRLAAEMLEASVEDLVIEDGVISVAGVPDLKIGYGDLAKRLAPMGGGTMPQGFTPGLEATSYKSSDGAPTASGTNVAEVEVDIETGAVRLLRYSVGHDCGRMINPRMVDGQIVGGVVHGVSNALFERAIYDAAGQPLNTNYGDFLLPSATEVPSIDIVHQETPSPLNPLGVKGAGEGGTIPATAAVVAAIENALEPFGVVIDSYPVSPKDLVGLIGARPA